MSLIVSDGEMRGPVVAQGPVATFAPPTPRPSARRAIPIGWLAPPLLLSFAVVILLMARAGLTLYLEPWVAGSVCLYTAVAALILCRFRDARAGLPRISRDAAEYVSLFMAVCMFGAVAAYPVAADSLGFSDRGLAAVDRALRFDWPAWYAFVASHTLLQPVERSAYQSIFLTPALLLAYYAWTGRKAEARQFITGFWLAGVLTLLLFAFLPAQGPLALLRAGRLPYLPVSALYQSQVIQALRSHQLHQVDVGALRGLVGAPSFHTASGILYVAAAWQSRPLRWPITVLNLTMLLATPVEGTHYLADMLVGSLVAIAALAGASGIARGCAGLAAQGARPNG